MYGKVIDFKKLKKIIKDIKANIYLIEDAAESLGAFYPNSKIPAGSLADISCLSFNGNKIISSGGGGLIITNNHKLSQQARYLINQAKDNSNKYIHNSIGYNFRMSNLHAAIGLAQLERINDILIKKNNTLYKI